MIATTDLYETIAGKFIIFRKRDQTELIGLPDNEEGNKVKGIPNSDIYDCCRNSISDFTTLGRLKQTLKFLWKNRLDFRSLHIYNLH